MRRSTCIMRIVATTLLVFVGGAASRANAIKIYDRVIDLGSPAGPRLGGSPKIDDDSRIFDIYAHTQGDFTLGAISDPNMPARTIAITLQKTGSTENLLPAMLRNPSIEYQGINSSGHVVGLTSRLDTGQSTIEGGFFFAPESDQLVQVKSLPGAIQRPIVYGINDFDQMVGYQEGKAIFYATPTSEPVELSTLLQDEEGWKFYQATGINNLGEIVGTGSSPEMEYGITNFKLEPVATPEPTALALFAAMAAGLVARSRSRRGRSPASRVR